MGNILYVIAVVMILFWAIGFFVYSLGALIHIMLVLAIVSIVARLMSGNRRINN